MTCWIKWQHQAITDNNADYYHELDRPSETNLMEIWIKIQLDKLERPFWEYMIGHYAHI